MLAGPGRHRLVLLEVFLITLLACGSCVGTAWRGLHGLSWHSAGQRGWIWCADPMYGEFAWFQILWRCLKD
ncbi:hypothetical protein VNO80_22210 [Phaseolus coccineus]|uniref:Uncharacterized protein n=1 Tax=Phaseolus coccineus TaxID=3886 RepID=A0AAN9QYH3_PHACN